MNPNSDRSSNPGTDGPKPSRRRQISVRGLIVLVACCGAIFWAWRHLSENYDPVRVEARSIQERAIGALRSGEPAERVTAIVALSRLDPGDNSIAIPPLIRALEDPASAVRVAAVEALESIGTVSAESGSDGEAVRAAATALIGRLKDPDPGVRFAACQALGSIGAGALESGSGGEIVRAAATALIEYLADPEPAVRVAAAVALGKLASQRLALMANPPIDRQAVIDALVERIGDREAGVRRAVIHVLASNPGQSVGPPQALAEALKDESAENRAAAVGGLLSFRQGLDPWVPHLLRLAEHDPDPSVRELCLTIMRYAFKPPAVTAAVVPVLIASLGRPDARVRTQAAWLLGEFRAEARAVIPALLRVLNEPLDPQVVPVRGPSKTFDPACEAAWALGRIAPGSAEAKEVIAALTEVARSGPLSRRGWAAVALGQFGPAAEEAVPVLITVLDDAIPDDSFERAASAALALGMVAPDTPSANLAVAALLPVLQSKGSGSRVTALTALLKFGPNAAAAIPSIRALKDDRDKEVRDAAAKALLAIEHESAP